MEYQAALHFAADFLEPVEVEFGDPLVGAVLIADGDCKRVDAGTLNEIRSLIRLGKVITVDGLGGPADIAEFPFNSNSKGFAYLYDLGGRRIILKIIQGISVKHDRRKPRPQG
jgi:hypothetical protein